jgi:uncharacterized protein YggT (Ycf19 family)
MLDVECSMLDAGCPAPHSLSYTMATPIRPAQTEKVDARTLLNRITAFFVYLFERITPDLSLFAVSLTIIAALLALGCLPKDLFR